ncbi:Delta(8)-fatty-acid desaturase [Scedosporium apiospermum]|uniref:Delta(8)-fatty-acid desaturase n=1 Tax=Pseudallescheria apiosperma TaxID=563466 RepID=A0A084FZ39_PSEDA|nr:Delta(8)-fatty-acid desaturase [Scedosporium apiospermum]KEZ40351.1 Delta(8)-fatty-acid desaturase [Scedosporium apiospermum]
MSEFTYQDVAGHNTKDSLYMVIHDKVYDCTKFIDEHPGGEEVLLDVGGQDATEAFEDVGHSDEARELLKTLQTGTINRKPGDPVPKASASYSSAVTADSSSIGVATYAIVLIGGVISFFAYQYAQKQGLIAA